ncbi:MAG: hypothetical protein ACFFBP_17385 [Promethearchaeota archaeon]
MQNQNLLKRKRMILNNNKKMITCVLFLGLIFFLPTVQLLKDVIKDSKDNSIFLKNSSSIKYTGIYDGGISTMGMKIEANYSSSWTNDNQTTIISSNNNTYNEFLYTLNRLDIRAYNLFSGAGNIDIAINDSNPIDIPVDDPPYYYGYIIAQQFTTPLSADLLAIDTVSLYINHDLPYFGFRTYLYVTYIYDEEINELLAGAIVPVDSSIEDRWISFDISSNILEKDTKYNIFYLLAYQSFGSDDYYAYDEITWKAENKTWTGNENKGRTLFFNDTNYEPILYDSSIDMLCNFTYQTLINPEMVDLKCKIDGIEYTPIYQQSYSSGALGYEALLVHNFDNPPAQDINITIYTNETVDSLDIEILQYYVYVINASGMFEVRGDTITWNITYQYYDIGAYQEELWFLYESDWELNTFYNTIGTPIEVYFGPISLYNESYYGLFDLWGTPLGIGDCIGIFQSPNYCNNIIPKIKVGDTFKVSNYLQLGKIIKLEAIIENSFNKPISGGIGNLTIRNPTGQIIYQEGNLISYNGILNSSEILLDTSYGVGIFYVDIFWTNGKDIAFYTLSIEVRHPEGYIPPEFFILTASLIGLAILATPASLVARKYIRQRNWEKSLRDLFVLTKQGVSMYNYSFGIELRRPELISGMISALSTFMQEATGSKEDLRTIDQQDKKVILNHGEYTTVALICDKDLPIIHKRVKNFTEKFENRYGKQLLNWFGETSMFKDAETIVSKFFPVSMEEQRIRGVKMKLVEFRERLLSVDDPMQIISIMREITDFSSRYQEIINRYSFKDFNELIKIAEQKIKEN